MTNETPPPNVLPTCDHAGERARMTEFDGCDEKAKVRRHGLQRINIGRDSFLRCYGCGARWKRDPARGEVLG